MPYQNRIGLLLTPELLEALEELWPLESPRLKDTDREIWFKVGQRDVVETLHAKFKEANESPLSNPILSS